MNSGTYLLIHKDHLMRARGINSGAEMASIFLARFLAKSGRRVVLAAILEEGECIHEGVEYWDLGPDFDVSRILRRARDLGPYHLISAGRAIPILESRTESNCISRSLITHDRAGNDTGIRPEILSRTVDNLFCVSYAQRNVFVSAGADASKVHVIHNGADLELFRPGNPEERDYKKLVFVGALIVDKGIHVLVNSFAKLKSHFPHITLDVYGSSSLWGREKLFDEAEVERQLPGIKFHGKAEHVVIAEAYRKAGICVIPSIWFDPFPLVSLEAQVTGCPVVAFNVGGLGEGMLPDKTGILLNEISEDALTRTLGDLLSNPERLKEMSKEALAFARTTFTWDKVVEKVTSLCESKKAPAAVPSKLECGTIGFLSTWNQECGLATYGKFLVSKLPPRTYVVLAEDNTGTRTAPDEDFVIRCWRKDSGDFSKLYKAIKDNNVKLLHLNCQPRFFVQPAFSEFLRTLSQEGVRVLTHVHNTFTMEESLQTLMRASYSVVVHTPENRLEAVANGAPSERSYVLRHGVDIHPDISDERRAQLRQKYSLPLDKKVVTCFGFVQAHKGMEGLVEGIAYLNQRGIPAVGVIAGRTNDSDPGSKTYMEALKNFAQEAQVSDKVLFLERFLSDQEVVEYLEASDVVLMNYRSNYFEASGACALAIGARAVVAASLAPPFIGFQDAVWHITGGYPVPLTLEILLTNDYVRADIKRRANDYCDKNS